MRINIGCGRDYREGWINIDISRDVKADAYLDIRKDLLKSKDDLKDVLGVTISTIWGEAADEIYISGVLEQILENEHLIHALNECHRVLKNGGVMTVIVPNAKYSIAHQDPMDVRKFTKETFPYFMEGTKQYKLYGSVYGFKPWKSISIEENERHILIVTMVK